MARPPLALPQVEVVLRRWRELRLALKDKEDDAVHGGYCTDFEARPQMGRPGNPTLARALRLATDVETRQLGRLIGAIDRALVSLGGQAGKESIIARAMQVHYLKGESHVQIAKRLGVSTKTVERWKSRFRVIVWDELGRRL